MVRRYALGGGRRGHFPHTRGDGPRAEFMEQIYPAFSPHAWGWSAESFNQGDLRVIFPTRVGMVRRRARTRGRTDDFPHTRGDGPIKRAAVHPGLLFSPHAWGWSVIMPFSRHRKDIFPTRVGMVRIAVRPEDRIFHFPHTRGDGPSRPPVRAGGRKFSPHAWGWSVSARRRGGWDMIFPTRVGMVRPEPQKKRTPSHFPHTRGDGPGMIRLER